MSKTILVTGATGNIGSLIIPQLVETGANVRALVRDAAKSSDLKASGVELFEGDFLEQKVLFRAAEGVDALMAITPAGPDAVAQGEALLQAARATGSPHYVRLSAIGAASDAPTANGRLHHQSDEAVVESGLTYTILRPHFFMQNLFMSVESINNEGQMYWGMGDGKLGMIDVRDIADSCVSILLHGGHENRIYTPTGPDSISFHDIATIISKGIGKEVNYIAIPVEAVGKAILDAGWGEWGAQVMMDYSRAYSEGWGDFTNKDVEMLSGNGARSFGQFYNEVLSSALIN